MIGEGVDFISQKSNKDVCLLRKSKTFYSFKYIIKSRRMLRYVIKLRGMCGSLKKDLKLRNVRTLFTYFKTVAFTMDV